MKRFLSLTIVLMVVLSLVQLPAFAAAADAVVDEDYTLDTTNKLITILSSDGWDWFATNSATYKNYTVEVWQDVTASVACGYLSGATIVGKKDGIDGKKVTITNNMSVGLVTRSYSLTVKDITLSGNMNVTSNYIGVLIDQIRPGAATANVLIENVVNNCSVNSTKSGAGGLIGRLNWDNNAVINLTVKNCVNNADISCSAYAGGLLGAFNNGANDTLKTSKFSFENCFNYGNITSSGNFAGGIIGGQSAAFYGQLTIKKCANIGNVSSGNYYAGGITGVLGNSEVSECYNSGYVKAKNYAGGIAGNANDSNFKYSIAIENSYNEGTIEATASYASGIIYSMSCRKQNTTDTDQKMVSVYNSGKLVSNGNKIHIASVAHTGTSGSYDIRNIYYTSHNNDGASANFYASRYDADATNDDKYSYDKVTLTALKSNTEYGFDTLPEGFDSSVWVACENGYPILRNNLPKNADGTDKEYWEVTLVNGENGEALKSEKTYVEKGTTYTLALEPSKGYEVESVTAGETVCDGTNDLYEITVSGDVAVTVAYSKIPVTESTVSASELFVPVDADRYEIYAFATYGVVEDNAATDFGMLLSFEETDDFTLDNSSLRKFSAYNGKGANEYGEYGVMLYGDLITEEGTYFCVPYVTYTDGTTCYGDVMTIGE